MRSSSILYGGAKIDQPQRKGVYRFGPIKKKTPWQYGGMSAMWNHDERSGEHRAGCRRAWVDSV
jgi:hypothetical protein